MAYLLTSGLVTRFYYTNFELMYNIKVIASLVLTFIFIMVDRANIVKDKNKGSKFAKILLITLSLGILVYIIKKRRSVA